MKKEQKVKVNVVQDKERPVEKNILAQAILNIAGGLQALQRSGLTFEAIAILTQHNCSAASRYGAKPNLGEVRVVLKSLQELKQRFCA